MIAVSILTHRGVNIVWKLLVILLLPAMPAIGQTVPPKFEHITPAEGLSNERVYSIAQTPDGAIWVGTYHGLNRYDGYSITSFTTQLYDDPAIPLKIVNRIAADTKGNLWILSRNRFLRFGLASQRFEVIQHDTSGLFDESAIYYRGLAIDSSGQIWIGAINRLQRFNPVDSTFVSYAADSSDPRALNTNRIMDVTVDREGNVWVLAQGNGGELYRYDAPSQSFEEYPISYTPRTVAERALLADRRGKIWIVGSPDGVIEFDPVTRASGIHSIPMRNGTSHAISLFEDRHGRICIGGWAGFHIYDPFTGRLNSYYENKSDPLALQIDMISSVFEDRSGNLWLGVWGGGVDVIKEKQKQFGHFGVSEKPGDASEWVTAISGDTTGTVWLGTGRGLFRFEWETKQLQRFLFYTDDQTLRYGKNHVVDVLQRDDGMVWVSTFQGGLALLDPRAGTSRMFLNNPENPNSISDNFVQHLMIDSDGDLWIAGRSQGLNLLKKGASAFIRFQHVEGDTTTISTNRVWRAYQDRRGRIWVLLQGAGASLSLLDKNTGRFTRMLYDKQHPQSSRFQFRHIHEEPDGTFWLGGEDNGLVHFDPATGAYEQFTEREGLPYAYMGGFLHDGRNSIFFVSPKGLSQFSISEKEFRTFQYGIDIRERSYSTGAFYRASNGFMYFGGRNGVTYFHPDSIRFNSTPPETRIVDFQVFGKSLQLPEHISMLEKVELSYDENYFSFGFVGLDYTDPPKNQFAYMMEGFDRTWVQSGTHRYASYTHLNPGTYTFRVKSSNNDGVWDQRGQAITVIVQPAWWQTWWFRLLAVLTVAAALYTFYRYRLNRALDIERTRTTIATDLHDDIGTTLTSIALFSDLAKADIHSNTRQAIERLDRIASSSRLLLDQMNDIVWSVKPQNDSLQNAILRMTDVAATLFEAKGIEHTISLPEKIDDVTLSMQQRRNILLIYKEMLNNVVKHSGATSVNIEIATDGRVKGVGGIRVSVKDNGTGFEMGRTPGGNGLKNMQMRAAAIGGKLEIRSAPARGTHAELIASIKSHK